MSKASPCTHRSTHVSPNNPVLLTHASGHAVFVNAKAMEAGHVTRDTANPAGGEILKDKHGNPTGLLRESAQGLANRAHDAYLAKRTPAEAAAELRQVIDLASKECLSKGITSLRRCRLAARHRRHVSRHG